MCRAVSNRSIPLPCPFCGSRNIEHHEVEGRANHSFECCECLASSMCKPTCQEALEAWNRRAPQPVTAQAATGKLSDSERLNFLEKEFWNSVSGYGHLGGNLDLATKDDAFSNSLRDAIDAALAAQGGA